MHARGACSDKCVKGCELTFVEQRAQIDQVVRVEVGGAAGLALDKIAQVACIGPRFLFEVAKEYAKAIALVQLPACRRRMGQAAACDRGLALCCCCSRRRPCRMVYLVHRQN